MPKIRRRVITEMQREKMQGKVVNIILYTMPMTLKKKHTCKDYTFFIKLNKTFMNKLCLLTNITYETKR